jgi:NAD(P)-dependent dehydrogenase (short-subunit alcohol dehydrogenase family)
VNDPADDLAGSVALIAGAGPGIGRACALALAGSGADVVVAARRRQPLQALADEVTAHGGRRALAVPADIGDLDQCRRLVDTAVDAFGRVDVVVNVATHSGGFATVEDLDFDDYRRAFEVNVLGTLEISRTAARHMKTSGGGSIIQIGTQGVRGLNEGQSAYIPTKAAMVRASLVMAKEVGRHGSRVNIVTPGYTTGEPLERMFGTIAGRTGSTAAEVSAKAAARSAMRRHVDPEDIASAVLFLASERARNITGDEITVSAGLFITWGRPSGGQLHGQVRASSG